MWCINGPDSRRLWVGSGPNLGWTWAEFDPESQLCQAGIRADTPRSRLLSGDDAGGDRGSGETRFPSRDACETRRRSHQITICLRRPWRTVILIAAATVCHLIARQPPSCREVFAFIKSTCHRVSAQMRLLYRGVSPPVGSWRTSFGEMVRKPSAGGPLTVMDPVLNEIRQEPHVQSVLSLHASPAVILLIRTLISAAIQERKKKKKKKSVPLS